MRFPSYMWSTSNHLEQLSFILSLLHLLLPNDHHSDWYEHIKKSNFYVRKSYLIENTYRNIALLNVIPNKTRHQTAFYDHDVTQCLGWEKRHWTCSKQDNYGNKEITRRQNVIDSETRPQFKDWAGVFYFKRSPSPTIRRRWMFIGCKWYWLRDRVRT